MKAEIARVSRRIWRFLTVVPGWPDAGRLTRSLYALPLVVPFAGLLLLWGWDLSVRRPGIGSLRAACAPAVVLAEEVEALAFGGSDAQAATVAEEVASLQAGLVRDAAALGVLMERMRGRAASAGWDASMVANEPVLPAPGERPPLVYRSLRGRLAAGEAAGDFRELLLLLEELVPAGVRGGVSRVAIRADEQGRLSVDFGVRLAVFPPDEETP